MKKLYLALMCLVCVVLCSCHSSKQAAIKDLGKLTTEIQENGATYDTDDWRKAVKKYKKVNENLAKHQYNPEEMEQIGQMQGDCVKAFAGALGTKVTGIISFLKGLGNSLGESWTNFDVNKLFKK